MAQKIRVVSRIAVIISLTVGLFWLALVVVPMSLTRWRMSRLLADYHSIYPMQSNWDDAKRLMARWGSWGRYEGTCNATDCEYLIRIDDPYANVIGKLSDQKRDRLMSSTVWQRVSRDLGRLGYRASTLAVLFQVQDSKIVRTHTLIHLSVTGTTQYEPWPYVLGVYAETRSHLSNISLIHVSDPPLVEGDDEQLALHPDYKVGRPGGCEGCEIDEITYAPTLPHDEAVRLTDFNLSCLTTLRACTTIGALLPGGAAWHLYEHGPSSLIPASTGKPLSCHTEARALGRDAAAILEVEVLDELPNFQSEPNDEDSHELVRVKILREWKSTIREIPGSIIQVTPFSGEKADSSQWPAKAAEHLLKKHRALIFLREDAATNFSSDPEKIGVVAYPLDACGVIDDTPSNLEQVQIGVAQDVPYRHQSHTPEWW